MIFSTTNIAVSSWTWHDAFYKGELNLVEIPAKAREAGISQVELNDFMLPPGRWSRTRKFFRNFFGYQTGNSKQQRYVQSTINDLIDQLNKYNVRCVSWTIESDLTVSEDHWRKELAYIIKGIETAEQLNAKHIRLTLGGSERMGAEIDLLVTNRLKLVSELCRTLFPNIHPLVENHWGLTTNINRYLNIIDSVPDIGVCFDPGNIQREGREESLKKLASKAQLFHIKIYDLHAEKLDEAIPYQSIFEDLISNQFSGKLIIEYEGGNDPAVALESIISQLSKWPMPTGFKASTTCSSVSKGDLTASAASIFKPLRSGQISLTENQ